MTDYRKQLLDRVAKEQGLETPITLTVFKMSDLYPKSSYDNMIADLYIVLCEAVEEQEEDYDDDYLYEEVNYSPFDGQSSIFDDIEF